MNIKDLIGTGLLTPKEESTGVLDTDIKVPLVERNPSLYPNNSLLTASSTYTVAYEKVPFIIIDKKRYELQIDYLTTGLEISGDTITVQSFTEDHVVCVKYPFVYKNNLINLNVLEAI